MATAPHAPRRVQPPPLWVRRHWNPLGLALRGMIFLGLFWSLWEHSVASAALCGMVEALNWRFVPAIESPPTLVRNVVETELAWLRAPWGWLKTLSLTLLTIATVVGLRGLWLHRPSEWGSGLVLMAAFGLVMQIVAARQCESESKDPT